MNNLSGFMDPLANLSRYQNQPRPPADDETKSHSQIDGARIIPIFVETRVNFCYLYFYFISDLSKLNIFLE